MGFKQKQASVDKTVKVIEREVQVPKFREVDVIQPRIVEKRMEVKVPDFVKYEVKEPVITKVPMTVKDIKVVEEEYVVKVPKFVEYEVKVPKFVEYEVKVPKFIDKIVEVTEVKIVPKVVEKEIIQERIKWVDVERDHVIDRPKFRDVHVDVIKPHYKCQACGQTI